MQNILISFESDTSGITSANEALEQVAGKDKKLGEAAAQTNKILDEQIKKIDAGSKSVAAYADKLSNAGKLAATAFGTKALDDFGKNAQAAFAKLVSGGKDANAALKTVEQELKAGINDALKQAGVSADEFQQALAEAGITAEEFAQLLVEGTMSSEAFNTAVDNTGKKSKSLKSELRALKEELSRMEEAGEDGSAQFQEMAIRAAQLEDQIGDTAERIRALSSDTANIDAVVEGVQMLGAGFQIAQGASALFGDENEELQKVLVKLNAVMAITQGLQQVQGFLRGQSILALKAEAVATTAATFAQRVYATAVGTSTGAMKAFRVALLATGIGAIVVVIGLLISELIDLAGATDDSTDAFDANREEAERLAQALNDVATSSEKLRNAQAGGLDGLQRELTILKAKGATAKAVFDQEQKIRQAELFNLGVLLSTFEGNKEKQLEISKSIADKETEIEAAKLAFNKEQQKKALDDAKESAAKRKEIAERNARAEFEILQRGLERQKTLFQNAVEAEDNPYSLRLVALNQFLAASNQLLDAQKKEELSKTGLTATEVKNINDKYRALELSAIEAFNAKSKELRASAIAAEKEDAEAMTAEFIAADKAKLDGVIANIDSLYAGIDSNNKKELDERLQSAQTLYDQGAIDLQTYLQKREQIIREFTRREISNEITKLEAIRATQVAAGESTVAVDNAIYEQKERLRQFDVQQHQSAEQKKTQSTDKEEAKRKEIREAAVNAAFQVLGTVANAYFEGQEQARQNELNDALNKLKERRDAELSVKNITEQQKTEINARYAAKERQLKLKAFEEDKKAKKSQAMVSAALAIIQAFAQLGPLAGAIAAVTVGVATALQISKIDQATPGFKKGKININGPGTTTSDSIFARISKGESVVNAAATAKYTDALEAINSMRFEKYLATIAPQYMKESGMPTLNDLPEWASPSMSGLAVDYDQIGKSVAKYSQQPSMTMNADRDGLHMFLNDGNRRIEILNKRYKL